MVDRIAGGLIIVDDTWRPRRVRVDYPPTGVMKATFRREKSVSSEQVMTACLSCALIGYCTTMMGSSAAQIDLISAGTMFGENTREVLMRAACGVGE